MGTGMNDYAIDIQGLGKRYQLGQREQYKTLRGAFSGLAAVRVRRAGRRRAPRKEPRGTIWALDDVSLQVAKGEVVGLIGRNGSGKSTLLKILTRITEPTRGRAVIIGRVGSLLEVGTGFHPELTGRENIYLNGAILGMKRAEIGSKFDEIVAFAEIERFIDTPVKRYSSGMYVRLAFAVAAHLETEILLVDEVLAVGDAAFQRRCLGKMSDAAHEGRTVLFVSHAMNTVQQLCDRVVLLRSGVLVADGPPSEVVPSYLSDASNREDGIFDLAHHPARVAGREPLIRQLVLRGAGPTPTASFFPDEPLRVELTIDAPERIRDPRLAVAIEDSSGRRIMTLASYFQAGHVPDIEGNRRIVCVLPELRLGSGRYLLSVSLGTKYTPLLDSIDNAAWLQVGWRNNYGNGEPYLSVHGPVLADSRWEFESV